MPRARLGRLSPMLEQIQQLEDSALTELAQVNDAPALEAWRVSYLGSKGKLKGAMAGLKDVPKADKPAVGQRMNSAKQSLEAAFEEAKSRLASAAGLDSRRTWR